MTRAKLYEDFLRVNWELNRSHSYKYFKGIASAELILLYRIKLMNRECKSVTISDLAKSMSVSPPAISRTISSLEDNNFIKRVTNPNDRRIQNVVLTQKGLDKFKETNELIFGVIDKILKDKEPEEIRKYIDFTQEIVQKLKEVNEEYFSKGDE